jgi:hypothetical protein
MNFAVGSNCSLSLAKLLPLTPTKQPWVVSQGFKTIQILCPET